MSQAVPFGGWRSPLTAASVAAGEVPLGQPQIIGQDIYWLEGRPREGGRTVIVRHGMSGERIELTPSTFDVRTRVHEYGGGDYVVHGSAVFFSNFDDQRLYRQDAGGEPCPITPEPDSPAAARYADARVTSDGELLICVRESDPPSVGEPVNELVVIPTDGSTPPRTIVSGHDFFAAPRISPDGRRLTWLTWDHPRMPWDGSQLWVGDLAEDGSVHNARCVAGGPSESIFQPEWSPRGDVHFVSDRTGWWNLYRLGDAGVAALAPMDAEFGVPHLPFRGAPNGLHDKDRLARII
jgi:dipeptidyl aminopeptidase/acylaminoacyl peptidase